MFDDIFNILAIDWRLSQFPTTANNQNSRLRKFTIFSSAIPRWNLKPFPIRWQNIWQLFSCSDFFLSYKFINSKILISRNLAKINYSGNCAKKMCIFSEISQFSTTPKNRNRQLRKFTIISSATTWLNLDPIPIRWQNVSQLFLAHIFFSYKFN